MKPTTDETAGAVCTCATETPSPSQGLYRGLFEASPVSLWEEDASEVKKYLDDLKRSGAGDIRTYLDYHPEEVAKCAGMVKVLAVNAATADLYEAEDAAVMLHNLDKVLCEESYDALKQILVAIAEGETSFEANAFNRTLKGNKKHLLMRWSVAPGYEDTYERVWISMLDLTEHELFAKELDDTDKRYRMFAEYINDVIWTMDMGLNFTFFSPSVERALGYTADEILNKHFDELLTPASLEIAMAAVAEELSPDAMRTRDPRRTRVLELEFLTKNRSSLWGELNISFMLDKENVPTGVVGVIRDISDRRMAGEALERSWRAQKVINDLLQISLEDIPRDEMLEQMIGRIVDVPWFAPEARGGILLKDGDSDMLIMRAESGLGGDLIKACAKRKVGECFCGSAAASGEIMYRAGEGGAGGRECQPGGPHSQYCVPFKSSDTLFGALNLYLDAGHTCSEKEMEFLSAVGRVLASSLERRQGTEILRKSEASYRAVFDKASDSIFIHDSETGRILDVNPKACELFGYSHDRMLTLDVGDISAGGDSPFHQQDAVRLIKEAAAGGSRLVEWHCKDSSGRLFWVEVNLSLARLGSGERILAFVRDIDARKRAEQKAMALSHFLEGIMDTVNIWVSAADREGNLLVWNHAAERISGYARDSVVGNSSVWALMYPNENMRGEYMEERCRVLKSGVFCDRHNTSIVTASGETKTVCWNCYKLADGDGELCGAIALAFDITGRAEGGEPNADLKEYVIRALENSEA
jgi:PAS domain S-box-containing protein